MAQSKLKTREPLISIIIPLYAICDRFFHDLRAFDSLRYKNYELIVVCDQKVKLPILKKKIKFLFTGQKQTGPAEKRDLALQHVKGEICAFIDDDAYPAPSWLHQAARHFRNPDVIAVGGVGLTPPEDSFWQKISGYILESYLGSDGIQHHFYQVGRKFFVKSHPAYNLFIRTNVLKKVGYFGSKFYGGEDLIVCMKIEKHGWIFYDSSIVVYHHRRYFPLGHLKQIGAFGLKRGYLFKRYPKTSRSMAFLLPTILSVGLYFGITVSVLNPQLFLLPFMSIFLLTWLVGMISILRHGGDVASSVVAGFGIIVHHLAYGTLFIKGFFTRHLSR